MTSRLFNMIAAAVVAVAIAAPSANAEEIKSYDLIIKDHKFIPQELEIPANQKVKLIIKNQDKTAAEFESHELKREKVIQGNSQAVVFVGPLSAGRYPFFDEFNEATTKGAIVVK